MSEAEITAYIERINKQLIYTTGEHRAELLQDLELLTKKLEQLKQLTLF